MAALATNTISRSGLTVSLVAAGGSGDTFTNTGAEYLEVLNGNAATCTVTIVTSETRDGLAVADRTVAILTTARAKIGPFPTAIYGTTVSVTYSVTSSVTVGVFKLTPVTY